MSLVPKIKNLDSLYEYNKPISVMGSLYKILSKLITNRIKPLISEVISDTHKLGLIKRGSLLIGS